MMNRCNNLLAPIIQFTNDKYQSINILFYFLSAWEFIINAFV